MEYIPSYSDSIRADILPSYSDSLMHHGIKGMHWGVRRFEDASGHLTPAGKKRYDKYDYKYASSSSKTSTASAPKKRKLSAARKVALGVGTAALLYGAHRAYSQKMNADYESKRIDKSHAKELDEFTPEKRKAITDTIAREQTREVTDTDRKRIFSRKKKSHVMNDNEISNRIKELGSTDSVIKKKRGIKDRWDALTNPTPKDNTTPKRKTKNSSNKPSEKQSNTGVVAVKKKKTGSASSETIAVRNANRLASTQRQLNGGTNPKPANISSPTPKPKSEPAPKPVKKKEPKPKKEKKRKKGSFRKTIRRGVKAYRGIKAISNHDIAEPLHMLNQDLVDATENLIKRARAR